MIIDPVLYERIRKKKAELDARRPLPLAVLEKLRGQFAIELAYNSNAIEGNSLTLRETKLVIEEGITIRGKPLREHFEAINHQKAFHLLEEVVQHKGPISEQIILNLHKLILTGINDTYAGRYRDINVRIIGAVKSPPRFEKVEREMGRFAEFLAANPDRLDPVELAAVAHYKLVEIHPFADGNGRTARLLMNLILMKYDYPIAIIECETEKRKAYYAAIRAAHAGNLDMFELLVAEYVNQTADKYIGSIPKERS